MQAGKRFHLWIRWRKFKKQLKRRKGIELTSGGWYVVSDYGWEDCSYQGSFTLEQAIKEFYQRYNWNLELNSWKEYLMQNEHNLFDHTTSHYITNEQWRLERISERNEGW